MRNNAFSAARRTGPPAIMMVSSGGTINRRTGPIRYSQTSIRSVCG
jgi:hypothetical protein